MWKIGIVLAAILAVGWFAFPEVRVNIAALAPFAIVLLCPLAMLFGMRGYGEHGGHGGAHGHAKGGCCVGGSGADAKPSERKA